MHARAIYNVLTQGRTVQKGGSNTPGKSHPAVYIGSIHQSFISPNLVAYTRKLLKRSKN